MSDLDEEIARIAALRGKTADDYAEARKPRISMASLEAILLPHAFPDRDLEFYDRLPASIREVIRETDEVVNATAVYRIWYEVRDESLVCQAVRHMLRRSK